MKELGEYLKQTRISNGVSLTEACEDLELSTSHLENIESGNVRAFKDVYELRESVKLYAKYLGLNPDKVVEEPKPTELPFEADDVTILVTTSPMATIHIRKTGNWNMYLFNIRKNAQWQLYQANIRKNGQWQKYY